MLRSCTHHRSLLIALAAMAGMVLGAPAEPARATPAPAKAKSCCARPMPPGCRCCAPVEPACPAPAPPQAVHPVAVAQVSFPADPCACRPAPSAPREGRPESRTAEERPSEVQQLGAALVPPFAPRQSIPVCALFLSLRAGPSPIPLFLRDERLRF